MIESHVTKEGIFYLLRSETETDRRQTLRQTDRYRQADRQAGTERRIEKTEHRREKREKREERKEKK